MPVTGTFKFGRWSVQPKLDIFNVLNGAPVHSGRSLLFGTTADNQPNQVLNPRTMQIGAIVRF